MSQFGGDMEKEIAGEELKLELTMPGESHEPEHKTKRISLVVPPTPPPRDDPSPPPMGNPSPLPRDKPSPPMLRTTPIVRPTPILDPLRPMTSSTKRLSFSTIESKRMIKYGKGRYAATELVPQPSDDPDDPLNWPWWRKELNFCALLMMVGLINGMKTAFVSVNGQMAVDYNASYTAVASLTAVPLVLSAFTGLLSTVAARIWGKRPVYLVSTVFVFIGSMWNMRAGERFGDCMGARVFQGLGWGAFDMLLLGSIHDTYFEHEQNLRLAVYQLFCVITTWGPPLTGGLASERAGSFTLQFEVINVFWLFALPLMAFGAPETVFDRYAGNLINTPASGFMWSQPLRPRGRISVPAVKEYLGKMKPFSYRGDLKLRIALQAPRAFAAPTVLVLFLTNFLPYCTLWGLTQTVSLLFSTTPFMLSPSQIGSLMAAPFVISIGTVAAFSLFKAYQQKFSPQINMLVIGSGTFLAVTGILAYGVEIYGVASGGRFAMGSPAEALSFPLMSILLGFLAGGVYTLMSTVRPLVMQSSQFTSSNILVCMRNRADMSAGVLFWQTLFAGVFVMALPNAVSTYEGLKATALGVGITQIILGVGVGFAWRLYGEHIRRWDGKVMGLIDLSSLKKNTSFFDYD